MWMVGRQEREASRPGGTRFDVFVTMDRHIEFQQNLATLPIATLVVEAQSNRIEHLQPLVAEILRQLNHIPPKSLRQIERRLPGET